MFIETLGIDSSDLNEQLLQERLIDERRKEGKTIDYKERFDFTCHGPNKVEWDKHGKGVEGYKLEFLKDVSSFANASGGVLVYGIRAKHAIPTDLLGMSISDKCIETINNELNDLILQYIEPRMVVKYYPIPVEETKKVWIVSIPKSWMAPHQVVYNAHNRFHARSEAMNRYELDVNQIRSIFLLTATATERIHNFVEERALRITQDKQLRKGPKVILHLTPQNSFDQAQQYSLQALANTKPELLPISARSVAGSPRPNVDGLMRLTSSDKDGKSFGYIKIFKNGIIESVDSGSFIRYVNDPPRKGEHPLLYIHKLEAVLITRLREYLPSLSNLGAEPPICIFLRLINVEGVKIMQDREGGFYPADDNFIDLNFVTVPGVSVWSYDDDPYVFSRDIIDPLWNAGGYLGSPNFSEDGTYANKFYKT